MRWIAAAVAIFALTLLLGALGVANKTLGVIAYIVMLVLALIGILKPQAAT